MMRRRLLLILNNGEIPPSYQQVEYIESPGFCWFDITVPCDNSIISSDIIFQLTLNQNNQWCAGDGRNYTIQHEYGYYGRWYNDGTRATYETLEGNGATAKMKGHYNNYNRASSDPIMWRMFGRYGYSSSSGNNVPPCRIWNCSVTVNGNKAFDLIPCYRKNDNVVGMYDIINSVFYTNEGTGSGFILPS